MSGINLSVTNSIAMSLYDVIATMQLGEVAESW